MEGVKPVRAGLVLLSQGQYLHVFTKSKMHANVHTDDIDFSPSIYINSTLYKGELHVPIQFCTRPVVPSIQ